MTPRHAARVDENQSTLVKALRARGYSVACTHAAGKGFPDLVVGRNGLNWLLEIKDPAQEPARRKLTPAQVDFHARWAGQIAVVETIEDCLEAMEPTNPNPDQ